MNSIMTFLNPTILPQVRTGLRSILMGCAALVFGAAIAGPAAAQGQDERLCDNSFEDCRAPILAMIQAETAGLDVSFWFMTDNRYSQEIIKRWQAGVPVRVLVDLRADANYPANASIRQSLIAAGIPIRHKTTTGINHWKMILYSGQAKMHFSASNFANGSYSPIVPYTNYVDEAIYFTDDPSIVQSFMTKYDDLWTDTVHYQNLANITQPLARSYPVYPISSDLNFPPDQDYQDRVVAQLKLETTRVDAVMFRITSAKIPDELIRRVQAGVPVRLITDQAQYRNDDVLLGRVQRRPDVYGRRRREVEGRRPVARICTRSRSFSTGGISRCSDPPTGRRRRRTRSASTTTSRTKPWFVDWFIAQFNRKWNNLTITGAAISPPMFYDFVPGVAGNPGQRLAANAALGYGHIGRRFAGKAAGGRTSTISTSGRPTRRRWSRRTTCPARPRRASVRIRNLSTRARRLHRSYPRVPLVWLRAPRTTGECAARR